MKDTSFFTYAFKEGLLVLVVNPEHPFYKKIYKPLIENETKENRELRNRIRPPSARRSPRRGSSHLWLPARGLGPVP